MERMGAKMTGTSETVTCAWFALCDLPAMGCVEHPVLGWVPTCQRCADKLDLALVLGTFTVEAGGGS